MIWQKLRRFARVTDFVFSAFSGSGINFLILQQQIFAKGFEKSKLKLKN